MTDGLNTNDKVMQPIKLDTEQLKELDRLIDSLKKEIIYPGKGPIRKPSLEKAKKA